MTHTVLDSSQRGDRVPQIHQLLCIRWCGVLYHGHSSHRIETFRGAQHTRNYRKCPSIFCRYGGVLDGHCEGTYNGSRLRIARRYRLRSPENMLPSGCKKLTLPGTITEISVPDSAELRIVNLPRMRAARSRIPRRP